MCCRVSYTWHHDFPKLAQEAGFCFNDPKLPGSFDWACIGTVDVERIYKERDFASLEYSLRYILDGPLGNLLDSHVLDPAVSKLFRISQLAVQYLLFCKQFLDRSVTVMRDSIQQYQKEIASFKKQIKTKDEQIFKLRQKRNLPDAFPSVVSNNPLGAPTPSCHVCGKTFLNVIYLQAHMLRRHHNENDEEPVRDSGPSIAKDVKLTQGVLNLQEQKNNTLTAGSSSINKDEQLIDNVKLMLEIKLLKDRLTNAEKTLVEKSSEVIVENNKISEDIIKKDASVNTDCITEQTSMFDEDQKKYRDEIVNLKEQIAKSIEDLKNREPIWSEVRMKMDLQENLWKTRCDALESKLDKDHSKLLEMLNNIISSKHDIEKVEKKQIKGKPIVLEVFRQDEQKHEPKIITVSSARNQKDKRFSRHPIEVQTVMRSSDVLDQSLSSESVSVKSPIRILPTKTDLPSKAPKLIEEKKFTRENEVQVFEKELSDDVEDQEVRKDGPGKEASTLSEDATSNELTSIIEDFKPQTLAPTPQRRTVTSLRGDNTVELQKYRDSIVSGLNKKLWQLNINPAHEGLLDLNFQNTMRIIAHERKLKNKQTMKYGQNLEEIRAEIQRTISKNLENRGLLHQVSEKINRRITKNRETTRQKQVGNTNMSRVKTVMANLRTKSMEILPNLLKKHDVKKSPTKDANFDLETDRNELVDFKRDFEIRPIVYTSSPKNNENERSPDLKGKIQNQTEKEQIYYSDTASITTEDTVDDFDLDTPPKPKSRASTSLEKLLASPIKKPEPFDFNNLIRRTSSPPTENSQEGRNIIQGSNERTSEQPKNQAKKPSLAERPIVLQSTLEHLQSPTFNQQKFATQPMKVQHIFSRPSTSNKDAINAGISSDSDLSEEDLLSVTKKQAEVQDKPRKIFRLDSATAPNSNFHRTVESAIMGAEKKRVVFDLDANTHKTLSSHGGSQDDSDYGLSSIESVTQIEKTTSQPYKPESIILSTKQSPKRDEIAKEIQGQLKSLPKKPVGGIIAGISAPIQEQKDLSKEEYQSKKITEHIRDMKPLPKPRTKTDSAKILDDLVLSDFSF